ncbi:hypothetical protein [Streptomyces sp. P17]|uniref:hypothetical protein n=1 Tax=Streptomyces sp. P17 TaxID=3074716 RepID=UPI0037DC6185
MRRNTRRRPTGPRRAAFAAVALILGGGGLVATSIYASATEGGDGTSAQSGEATIDCPDVGSELTEVPDAARTDVDNELAALDGQIAEAYRQLRAATPEQRADTGFTDDSIMKYARHPVPVGQVPTWAEAADGAGAAVALVGEDHVRTVLGGLERGPGGRGSAADDQDVGGEFGPAHAGRPAATAAVASRLAGRARP